MGDQEVGGAIYTGWSGNASGGNISAEPWLNGRRPCTHQKDAPSRGSSQCKGPEAELL